MGAKEKIKESNLELLEKKFETRLVMIGDVDLIEKWAELKTELHKSFQIIEEAHEIVSEGLEQQIEFLNRQLFDLKTEQNGN